MSEPSFLFSVAPTDQTGGSGHTLGKFYPSRRKGFCAVQMVKRGCKLSTEAVDRHPGDTSCLGTAGVLLGCPWPSHALLHWWIPGRRLLRACRRVAELNGGVHRAARPTQPASTCWLCKPGTASLWGGWGEGDCSTLWGLVPPAP